MVKVIRIENDIAECKSSGGTPCFFHAPGVCKARHLDEYVCQELDQESGQEFNYIFVAEEEIDVAD